MIQPQTILFAPDMAMPNNPRLPVLVYRAALDPNATDKHERFKNLFHLNGWTGIWTNGIFDYHHFHSNAHEVLGIASGVVEVQLGGETGARFTLEAGDVVILPAGTGHKRLNSAGELSVIGAYPKGQTDYDICKSRTACPNAQENIAAVALPVTDPLFGATGPLITLWAGAVASLSS